MTEYTFSKNRIDQHVERVGLDVQPAIEVKMERARLLDFGQFLVEKHPMLFESLVTSIQEFHVRKKLVFPGKGEADVQTLILTARGPVFVFPRIISEFEHAETDLPDANEVVHACLQEFKKTFPDRKILRAGKVNEYVFASDDLPGTRIIAHRFLKMDDKDCENISLKVNLATDEYNRHVEMLAVKGVLRKMVGSEPVKREVCGVAVRVDFNNKRVHEPLDAAQISSILRRADEFNESDLYRFLNREA